MAKYIIRRLIALIGVLFGMTVLTFLISHVVPADPAISAAGMDATPEVVARIREEMGLNRPLWEQYLRYITGILLHADFGYSILNRRPVLDDILKFLPASIELAVFSMLICVPVGILLGLVTATRAGRMADALTRVFAVIGVSMPIFWLALLMQLTFYKGLGVLPAGGRLDVQYSMPPQVTGFLLVDSLLAGDRAVFISAVKHLILPSLTLAIANIAVIMRMTRSSLLEVMHQDYIRTARAKGLGERRVLLRHALRNAFIPVVTIIGLQFAQLIAWVFLVEVIFSWPGIGSYAVRSILNLDFQPIMGITLVISFIYVMINLATDVTYRVLDPRISY
jgi:peptide/nickel transport system permease protein